ncbi:MAG: ferritin-like domain-containing protein, partial [Cyanobacteria bacterium J06607_6]
MAINIGLSDKQRQGVVNLLNQALADAYLLLIKTKKYHWDVVGPQFRSLHTLWEEHYEALTISIDEIAERARMLGGYPLGTA